MDNDPPKPLDPDSEASAKIARKLLALIGAAERASGGSMELDRQLWIALGGGTAICSDWPDYTFSIDDAVSLIPDGWALDHLCSHWHVTDKLRLSGGASCKLATGQDGKVFKVREESGATLPLAIVIACLKARAELAQGIEARQGRDPKGLGSREPDGEAGAPVPNLPSGEGGVTG